MSPHRLVLDLVDLSGFSLFSLGIKNFAGMVRISILLLDEPGLSLHAKAQEDLLRYFEKELVPYHQLIYTTHSPFMGRSYAF